MPWRMLCACICTIVIARLYCSYEIDEKHPNLRNEHKQIIKSNSITIGVTNNQQWTACHWVFSRKNSFFWFTIASVVVLNAILYFPKKKEKVQTFCSAFFLEFVHHFWLVCAFVIFAFISSKLSMNNTWHFTMNMKRWQRIK